MYIPLLNLKPRKSREMKFYFIHISKTGGTSLRDALAHALGNVQTLFASTGDKVRLLDETKMHRIRIAGGHIPHWEFVQSRNCRAFRWEKFAVVRDPLDRLLSLYNYLSLSDHPQHACFQGRDLKDFCKLYARRERPDLEMCYYFSRSGLYSEARDVILRERIAVYRLDDIGLLAEILGRRLGVKLKLQHLNRSRGVATRTDLDGMDLSFLKEDHKLYQAASRGEFQKLGV